MLEILKKKARQTLILYAVIALAVGIGLLVWTKFAIINVIAGPIEMDFTRDPDSYKGKYVTVDADFFLTDYVEHTTTTTRKYGGSTTSVDGNSYIAFQWIDDYENQSSTWYYYSVYMKKSDQAMMYGLIDDTWNYMADETGTVAPPSTLQVKGTWTRMDDEIEGYYRQTLAEIGVEETEYDVFYFYTLETNKIGGVTTMFFWLMNIGALVSIVFGIYSIVGCFTDRYAKNINKYLQGNPSVSLSAVDADFAQAHPVGKDTWVGRNWTVYIRNARTDILANKDLIWGYYYRRTGRNSVSEMRLYHADGKVSHISMSEDRTKEALRYYDAEQPHMIVGYSNDLDNAYRSSILSFKDLKYNPVMNAASQNQEDVNQF